MNPEPMQVLFVGGFLGAGKTSLLYRAASLLRGNGRSVGLITNDQAAGLVDTAILQEQNGSLVQEVSGSCFCCNFKGLLNAITTLARQIPSGIILAEPVGSCTDLSATLMQPLKERHVHLARLAPLTVLADPGRLDALLKGEGDAGAYISEKQLDEADVILINKVDLLSPQELKALLEAARARWALSRVMAVSARTGEGIEEWLSYVLSHMGQCGTHLAQVDYDTYAAGEAAYGWLNASYDLSGAGDAADCAPRLLQALSDALAARSAAVGHVKFLIQGKSAQMLGNLTGGAAAQTLRQVGSGLPRMTLTLNARAELSPQALQEAVEQVMAQVFSDFQVTVKELRCLQPGRPNPTYRYDKTV